MFKYLNKGISTLIAIAIILLLVITVGVTLGSGIVEAKEITNPFMVKIFELIELLSPWIMVSVVPILLIFVWFLVFYFIVLLGFKILKIKKPSGEKIVVLFFLKFLFEIFITPTITKISGSNEVLYILLNLFTYFGITFLLLKYYLSLSIKQSCQFILFLFISYSVIASILFGIKMLL